jgi:hypothetical protein
MTTWTTLSPSTPPPSSRRWTARTCCGSWCDITPHLACALSGMGPPRVACAPHRRDRARAAGAPCCLLHRSPPSTASTQPLPPLPSPPLPPQPSVPAVQRDGPAGRQEQGAGPGPCPALPASARSTRAPSAAAPATAARLTCARASQKHVAVPERASGGSDDPRDGQAHVSITYHVEPSKVGEGQGGKRAVSARQRPEQ